MELTFKTRNYKTKVTKAATIHTNDLTLSQVKIRVSAHVDPAPDTTLPYVYSPDKLEFTQDDKKFEVIVTNTSDRDLRLSQIGDTYDGLSVKLDKDSLKPGKRAKIKFKWTGEFEKENLERSSTFYITGSGSTRFSVPFIVKGTDPTPPKKPQKKKLDTKHAKPTSGKK